MSYTTSYGNFQPRFSLFGEYFEVDPHRDLVLTEAQREEAREEMAAAFFEALNPLLPAGVAVLGNGEVIGPYPVIPFDVEATRDRLDAVEWWEPVQDKCITLSEENELAGLTA